MSNSAQTSASRRASRGAGCCAGVATAAGSILTELFENEKLLLGFCKFAFDVGGVLSLNQSAGRGAFRGDGGFDFTIRHGVVVVQLTELLRNIRIHGLNALLCLAAAVGNLRLKVTLPELVLIRGIGDRVVQVCKALEHEILYLSQIVANSVDALRGEVCAGFEFRNVGRIGDCEIRAERSDPGIAAGTAAKASISSVSSAPSEHAEEKKNPDPPTAAISPAVSVVHKCHCLPAVEAAGSAGVHVVNRNRIHD